MLSTYRWWTQSLLFKFPFLLSHLYFFLYSSRVLRHQWPKIPSKSSNLSGKFRQIVLEQAWGLKDGRNWFWWTFEQRLWYLSMSVCLSVCCWLTHFMLERMNRVSKQSRIEIKVAKRTMFSFNDSPLYIGGNKIVTQPQLSLLFGKHFWMVNSRSGFAQTSPCF